VFLHKTNFHSLSKFSYPYLEDDVTPLLSSVFFNDRLLLKPVHTTRGILLPRFFPYPVDGLYNPTRLPHSPRTSFSAWLASLKKVFSVTVSELQSVFPLFSRRNGLKFKTPTSRLLPRNRSLVCLLEISQAPLLCLFPCQRMDAALFSWGLTNSPRSFPANFRAPGWQDASPALYGNLSGLPPLYSPSLFPPLYFAFSLDF